MCFFFKKTNKKLDELLSRIVSVENRADSDTKTITTAIEFSNKSMFEGVKSTNDAILDNVKHINTTNTTKIQEIKEELGKNLTEIRQNLDKNLTEVRQDNDKQLKEMREVVEQKLTATLNERIAQSFNAISERLDAVNKGLGEMQALSNGVNDLQKVLNNVKTRGTWGEVSLENLLDNILTKEQFTSQFPIGKGTKRTAVDFAIILPGKGEEKVYLPIDVKFPIEDYQRLVDASERSDANAMQLATKALENAVKIQAKSIAEKYIVPPQTVDFAVMYLPIEGLYAEVVRNPGLIEELQSKYKVMCAGPTTISALLNSLQQGFRTLAVQKSSREVFDLLQKFKKDFAIFLNDIEKAQRQVEGAGKALDSATKRSNIIIKKLDKVEGLDIPEDTQTENSNLLDFQ